MTSSSSDTARLISADWLIDGTGQDAIPRGAVAVRGERIAAAGDATELAARFPEAERLHFSGHAIIPGLVDSHVHLTFSASAVPLEDVQGDGDVTVGLRGAINARDALLAGVTTLRDLGGRDPSSCAMSSRPAPFPGRACWRAAARSPRPTATATFSAASPRASRRSPRSRASSSRRAWTSSRSWPRAGT